MTRSNWRSDLLVAGLLFLLPLLLFGAVTVGPNTLLPADNLFAFAPWRASAAAFGVEVPHNALVSDLILENYAWKSFILESIRAGQLPLWNPNLFAGVPFLAAGQHSALYPFSLIYYVLPLAKAYGWFTITQLWLAGVCTFVLARTLKVGRAGALLAAVTYQLSGFFVVGAVFPMMIAGAAWLPLLLAMVERVVTQSPALGGRPARLPWAAIGAVGLGMVALAGHVEVLYYTLLVMAFYALWRLVALAIAGRPLRALLPVAGWLLAMVGVGMALGAVQTVPLAELARVNFRQGAASLAEVRGWAYPPRHALAFLMPNFFGSPATHAYLDLFRWTSVPVRANALGESITTLNWGLKNYVEGAAYVGVLPLLLAVLGLVRGGRSRWGFAALGGLSLTFAFGLPTYALLYYGLPFVNQLHTPFRWVWPFGLAVALLAGMGADALPGEESRVGRWLGRGALLAGVVGLLAVVAARLSYTRLEPLFTRALDGLALANRTFPDAQAFFSFEAVQVGLFALTLLLSGGVLLAWQAGRSITFRGRRIRVGPALAVALVAADLMVAWRGFHRGADPALLDFRPPVVDFLAQDEGLWRFTTYDEPGANTFNANAGWLYGFSDVRGYDSIIPKQYTDYAALIAPQTQLAFNRVAPIFTDNPTALESPLLDLLGVKYVVTETQIDTPGFEQVYADDSGIAVYENTRVVPRAFTLPRTASVKAADFGITAQTYDVRQYVLVDDSSGRATQAEPQAGELSPAAVTVYTPNEVWIDAEVDEASWLVLADSYFAGWRAWSRPIGGGDDEETQLEVQLVDGNFRGVLLPPGAHTVRMRYSPDSLKYGAFASFMALALIAFTLGVWVWRYAYRESDETSGVRRVAKNSLAPIFLNLFNRGIDFAFAFLMLRILRPEGAGNYYYAIVIWGWFEILTNFGLNTFLTREVARAPAEARRYLFNTSLLRIGLALLGIPALVGFLSLRQVSFDPPLTPETVWAIGLLYVGLFPSSLSTGLSALFYAFEKAEHPAAITTITTFVKAAVGVVALLAGTGIVGLAGVSIFTNVVTLILLSALAWRTLPPLRDASAPLRWERALQRHMAGESFPLMINHLLATLFFKVDVVLLEVIRGPATVGRYSTAYKWLDALNIVPSFFTLALFPVMSRQAAEDRPALLRAYVLAVKLMVILALPIAVATVLIARALIGVLGGPEYLPDGAVALQLIVWSIPIGWINSVTQYVLIALDRQRILTRAFVVAVAFNVGANLIFMPRYGFRAAAIITLFSELTLLVAFYLTLRRALSDVTPQGQREPVAWARLLWRPGLASLLMGAGVMAALPLGQVAALVAGGVVYAGALLALRPFTPEEVGQVAPLLPEGVRARLGRVVPSSDRVG